jgi:hypothetical protein
MYILAAITTMCFDLMHCPGRHIHSPVRQGVQVYRMGMVKCLK